MYKNIDPFMKILPQLDVHGFTEDIVMTVVNEFIEDSYKLGRKKIVVIHGKRARYFKKKNTQWFKK